MIKKQVLETLCALSTEVSAKVFDHNLPTDCFCGQNHFPHGYAFSDEVMDFIVKAVREAIKVDEVLTK